MAMSGSDRAARYVRTVLGGKKTVGELAQLAVARHAKDLKRQDTKGFPYVYVPEAADRVCAFIELMPHVKGRWASQRESIRLEDWQCFLVCSIFGWLHASTRLRRFREVYAEMGRKNAKSTLAAAICNYMLAADHEFGSEVYCGATTEKQAWEVFRPAKLMAERSPDFLDFYGVQVNAKTVVKNEDGSRMECLIGNPGDGSSPHCATVDEYHEHKSSDLYDTMVTGLGARDQPLLLIITTAGSNTAGPCYEKRNEVVNILKGVFTDETIFALIYCADPDDDWKSVRALKKANPNYNVSVSGDYLKAQIAAAVRSPAKQNTVKRKHLNIWTGANAAWLNLEDWQNAGDSALKMDGFKGEETYFAVDLASKLDLVARAAVFWREINGERHWYIFCRHYIPEDTVENSHLAKRYLGWQVEGHLDITDGAEINFDTIGEDVLVDAAPFQVNEIAYDQWRATQLAQQLEDKGATVVEVPQTYGNFNGAMRELEGALAAGRLHHDGDPVLTWMAGNVVAKELKGALMPAKDHAENKIDGMVAVLMAMSRALNGANGPSYYQNNDLMVI